MIAAPFLSLLLQAAAPPAAPSPPLPTPAESARAREHHLTLFFFYRLDYFHDVSALLGCARVDPDRTRALDGRYDTIYRGLVGLLGVATLDRPSRDPLQPGPDVDCRINSSGYDNALHQLERHLTENGR